MCKYFLIYNILCLKCKLFNSWLLYSHAGHAAFNLHFLVDYRYSDNSLLSLIFNTLYYIISFLFSFSTVNLNFTAQCTHTHLYFPFSMIHNNNYSKNIHMIILKNDDLSFLIFCYLKLFYTFFSLVHIFYLTFFFLIK